MTKIKFATIPGQERLEPELSTRNEAALAVLAARGSTRELRAPVSGRLVSTYAGEAAAEWLAEIDEDLANLAGDVDALSADPRTPAEVIALYRAELALEARNR